MSHHEQVLNNKKRFFTKYSVVNHLLFMLLNIILLMLFVTILIIVVTFGLAYFVHGMMYWVGIVAFGVVLSFINVLAMILSIVTMIGGVCWYVYRCEWRVSAFAWFFIGVLITGFFHMITGISWFSVSVDNIASTIIKTLPACLVLPTLNAIYFKRVMKYDERFH